MNIVSGRENYKVLKKAYQLKVAGEIFKVIEKIP